MDERYSHPGPTEGARAHRRVIAVPRRHGTLYLPAYSSLQLPGIGHVQPI